MVISTPSELSTTDSDELDKARTARTLKEIYTTQVTNVKSSFIFFLKGLVGFDTEPPTAT